MGFFVFLCAELSTSFLISPSLASAKRILLFSMTNCKFSSNACSFLDLYSVELKSDDGLLSNQPRSQGPLSTSDPGNEVAIKSDDRYVNNSLHLAGKYARIFVRGHYLFREANSFPRAKLEENCVLKE